MRIQNISQNNYNYQNSKNQPSFRETALCQLMLPKGKTRHAITNVQTLLEQPRFKDVFVAMARGTGLMPRKLFANRIFVDGKKGTLIMLDRDSLHVQEALKALPADLEEKFPDEYSRICEELVLSVMRKDPKKKKHLIFADQLAAIAQDANFSSGHKNTQPVDWFEMLTDTVVN